ncbi:hypothetical protein BXY51_007500 [Actinoplanes cyaneus]|nr:hypothetical protein [Actinoplanes cyaneus]
MLFVLCVPLGIGLLYSRRWHVAGKGLLLGWFAGVFAVLLSGIFVTALFAEVM